MAGARVLLPDALARIQPAADLPPLVYRRLTNEEIAAFLISYGNHEAWKRREAVSVPPSGSLFLFDRRQTKLFRKDGYNWKRRKSGTSIREDHMKLMVNGAKCLYGCYAHSEDGTFRRRTYWLVHSPSVVLVHYLDERDAEVALGDEEAAAEEVDADAEGLEAPLEDADDFAYLPGEGAAVIPPSPTTALAFDIVDATFGQIPSQPRDFKFEPQGVDDVWDEADKLLQLMAGADGRVSSVDLVSPKGQRTPTASTTPRRRGRPSPGIGGVSRMDTAAFALPQGPSPKKQRASTPSATSVQSVTWMPSAPKGHARSYSTGAAVPQSVATEMQWIAHQPAAQRPPRPRVVDVSPEACDVGCSVKVLVVGQLGPANVSYTCLFGGIPVLTEVVQEGVLRCHAPPAPSAGKVALTVAREGCLEQSTPVWFEYREGSTAPPEWLTIDASAFRVRLFERMRYLERLALGDSRFDNTPVDAAAICEQLGDALDAQLLASAQRMIVSMQVASASGADGARDEWGARVNTTVPDGPTRRSDPKGMTALHLACALGHARLVAALRALWDCASESPILDNDGLSVGDGTAEHTKLFVALALGETDPMALDFARCSPLLWACAAGSFDIAKVLVATDAAILGMQDAWGRSPAAVARLNKHDLLSDALEAFCRAEDAAHGEGASGDVHMDGAAPAPTATRGQVAEMWADVVAGSSSGLLDRDFSELTLRDRDYIELYRAARIIQNAFRDYKGSQRRKQMVDAAVVIQSHFRRYKESVRTKQMHAAAARIQNRYRTYRQHTQFLESRHAAVTIQRQFREHRQRKMREQAREARADIARHRSSSTSMDGGAGASAGMGVGDGRSHGGALPVSPQPLTLSDFGLFSSGVGDGADGSKEDAHASLDLANFTSLSPVVGV